MRCPLLLTGRKPSGTIDEAGNVQLYIRSTKTGVSRFSGVLSADGARLTGFFTSYGVTSQPVPLTLSR